MGLTASEIEPALKQAVPFVPEVQPFWRLDAYEIEATTHCPSWAREEQPFSVRPSTATRALAIAILAEMADGTAANPADAARAAIDTGRRAEGNPPFWLPLFDRPRRDGDRDLLAQARWTVLRASAAAAAVVRAVPGWPPPRLAFADHSWRTGRVVVRSRSWFTSGDRVLPGADGVVIWRVAPSTTDPAVVARALAIDAVAVAAKTRCRPRAGSIAWSDSDAPPTEVDLDDDAIAAAIEAVAVTVRARLAGADTPQPRVGGPQCRSCRDRTECPASVAAGPRPGWAE